MATRTVTTCDRCGAEGAKWEAELAGRPRKGAAKNVDLCDECFEALKDIHKHFMKARLDGEDTG